MKPQIIINETHLCVLKSSKTSKQIQLELLELNFPYSDSLLELKRMSENKNRNICELEEYVQNSSLSCLLGNFNFCIILNSAFENLGFYSTTKIEEYQLKIMSYEDLIEKAKSEYEKSRYKNELENYKTKKRIGVYNELKIRSIAFTLKLAYDQCKKDNQILAHSHRYRGYSFPEFKLGSDFDVIFKTNFGFGNSSYFYTNIRYKGIDILPYSDWIKYQKAEKAEIIRYTRRHSLDNSSWLSTMSIVKDAYNQSITNPIQFVDNWIINECKEMVDGLEALLNNDKEFVILDSFFNKNKRIPLLGIELVNFKGERISGALSFLEKIKTLNHFNPIIDNFIDRILNCNIQILPSIKTYIIRFTENIAGLKNEIDGLRPQLTELHNAVKLMNEVKQNIESKIKSERPLISLNDLKQIISHELNLVHPEYETTLTLYNEIFNQYSKLREQLYSQEKWKALFESYVQTIELYFEKTEQLELLVS